MALKGVLPERGRHHFFGDQVVVWELKKVEGLNNKTSALGRLIVKGDRNNFREIKLAPAPTREPITPPTIVPSPGRMAVPIAAPIAWDPKFNKLPTMALQLFSLN